MKKPAATVLLAILIAGGLYSCKKVIKNIFNGFDAEVPEIVLTIPFVNIPAGFPVPTEEIAFPPYTQKFNLDSLIKVKTANEFGVNDVSSIKLKTIAFALKNADAQNNFSNFQSARITFSSNTNSTPAPIAALSFPDVYAAADTFVAPMDTPELLPYLKGSELTYNVYGKLRRYTTTPLKLAVVVTLRVK